MKPKLSIICAKGLANFLEWARRIQGIEVRIFEVADQEEVDYAIEWGDIVWFEWANDVAVYGTQAKLIPFKKVLVRLHSYEVFSEFPFKIDWKNVHHLMFVADHVRDESIKPQIPVSVIPNGIDLDRFTFTNKQKGHDLAFVGGISNKKGPMLLLQCIYALCCEDLKYKLHIAGAMQEKRFKFYLKHMVKEMKLENNVIFYDHVDDVNAFLQDKQYIVCTSPWESQNMSVLEGMACGCRPLIHNFVGAKNIYSERYLWNSLEEFVAMVQQDNFASIEYREHAEEYRIEKQVDSIQAVLDELLVDVCKEPKKSEV